MRKEKQKRTGLSLIILVVIATSAFSGFLSYADSGIRSGGNFMTEDGKLAVYAEDIAYLQNEMAKLFEELPNASDNLSDS